MIERCFGTHSSLYADYHDHEWAVAVYNDQKLFEMLILEGAQAGLNWEIILKRREAYQSAFYHFEVEKVAQMKDEELENIYLNSQVVRHRKKIYSVRTNAQVFLQIQKEHGSFSSYLWSFVQGVPHIRLPQSLKEIPSKTKESIALSKDLKKRGMVFVGPTIMYAYMQAVGLVNDHIQSCFKSNGTNLEEAPTQFQLQSK